MSTSFACSQDRGSAAPLTGGLRCYRCREWPCSCEDGITLIHGDCRAILPLLEPESVDLVLTDPPYGIGEARKNHASRDRFDVKRRYASSDWDDAPPPRWLIELVLTFGSHRIVWGGNHFGMPPAACWLVWDKDNGECDFADCELAWTDLPSAVRRIKWRWAGMLQENMGAKEPRFHPTQKPVAVMKWAIQRAPDECLRILDPFAGSGTTGVAAKQLGRSAILIERELQHVETAARRLQQKVLAFPEATA